MRKTPSTSIMCNFVFLLIILLSSTISIFASNCTQTCGSASVPYPFGFTSNCKIQLNCSILNTISIGRFPVLNITSRSIFLNVSPSCSRELDSVSQFFSNNFELKKSNGLLLRNCSSNSITNCSIPTSLISTRLDISNCGNSSDSLSCFTHVPTKERNFITKEEILKTGCGYLYSSVSYYKVDQNLSALNFSVVELQWWMDGICNCSENAICMQVSSPVTGYTCECKEGFIGDGFKSGNGCFKEKKKNLGAAIGVVSGLGGALLLGTCIFLFLCVSRKKPASPALFFKPEAAQNRYNTHIFSYGELEKATQGFHESRELGRGGFGTVYKGLLRDGRTVAVKRLHERNCRLEQFTNEVKILSRLRHQNLVTLYGCTSHHSRELLLVYEYIPNGTIADHLHGPLTSKPGLPWSTRMSIIIQTAEALSYLHAVDPQIIHRDIKTNNILVDDNFQVKVADFGISRLFPLDASHISTRPQGTFGYLDPEYYLRFQLTDKSDVYSFGVVMIELISSKPAVDIRRNSDEISLAIMAISKIRSCRIGELVDPDLGYEDDLEVREMIDQVAQLAFRCLQSDAKMRPSLREVVGVLKRMKGEVYVA